MAKAPYTKPFLSYPEQLSLLKLRGMMFPDEEKALHLLEKIGYYRLSGYWYPLLSDKIEHIFKSNADFETAFSLYKFDRELRKLVSAEIEKIEVAIRAKMAYEFSMAYHQFWIEDASLFTSSRNHLATLDKIKEEYVRSNEEFILAFKNKYSDTLPPACIILEVASFGTLSRLYRNLKPTKTKRNVAKSFALSDIVFDSWLHSLACVRNVCAHHARFWNSQIKIQPLFPKKPQKTCLENNVIPNNRAYYIFSMIIYLLNEINPNHTFKQKLEGLFAKYPNIDRSAMGFPDDWYNELLWK
jgi:abortive infection bacteriophage resistance protein